MSEDTQQLTVLVIGALLLVFLIGSCASKVRKMDYEQELKRLSLTNNWEAK